MYIKCLKHVPINFNSAKNYEHERERKRNDVKKKEL